LSEWLPIENIVIDFVLCISGCPAKKNCQQQHVARVQVQAGCFARLAFVRKVLCALQKYLTAKRWLVTLFHKKSFVKRLVCPKGLHTTLRLGEVRVIAFRPLGLPYTIYY
jgi:hypothetical protein